MAIRQVEKNGRISTTFLADGPTVAAAGMGCAPGGCGMGALSRSRPPMSRGDAIALASGAMGGPRAARFALEAFRRQGASRAGMGDSVGTVTSPGFAFDAAYGSFEVDANIPVGNSVPSPFASLGSTGVGLTADGGSNHVIATDPAFFSGSTKTTGGGLTAQDVGTGITLASLLAGQGINAYRQFTGQPAPVAAPKPAASAGLSTGAILAILAVVTVGIGGAVALSSRGSRRSASAPAAQPTVIRANGKRFVRAAGNRYVRSNAKVRRPNRYMKKAA